MTRIEAGLVLIGVDFHSSRFAFNDGQCSTPLELGFAWMFRDLATRRGGSSAAAAIEREIADKTSRWKMVGLMIDWRDWDRHYGEAGLIPPKDETPVVYEMMLYDDEGNRVGYTTSFMYSPMLQRHIAMARVRPDLAKAGSRVNLEITINHRYHTVARRGCPSTVVQPAEKDSLTADDMPTLVRRDRHRWRPQRPGQWCIPRQVRPAHADHRAAPHRRRCGDHRGVDPRVPLHHVLVRAQPAASRHHPRTGADQARLHADPDAVARSPRWRTATTC